MRITCVRHPVLEVFRPEYPTGVDQESGEAIDTKLIACPRQSPHLAAFDDHRLGIGPLAWGA